MGRKTVPLVVATDRLVLTLLGDCGRPFVTKGTVQRVELTSVMRPWTVPLAREAVLVKDGGGPGGGGSSMDSPGFKRWVAMSSSP